MESRAGSRLGLPRHPGGGRGAVAQCELGQMHPEASGTPKAEPGGEGKLIPGPFHRLCCLCCMPACLPACTVGSPAGAAACSLDGPVLPVPETQLAEEQNKTTQSHPRGNSSPFLQSPAVRASAWGCGGKHTRVFPQEDDTWGGLPTQGHRRGAPASPGGGDPWARTLGLCVFIYLFFSKKREKRVERVPLAFPSCEQHMADMK